ncbi:PREDICTED: transcription factor TGA7-like isoform X2 [Ipomoea nil]|uniref:transcription factor TGA7-like isoform X2 n=1 Tax=Ipomoea nil TaxID=35883 RepID=UPI000901835E|nr:PREDICTED: transcription factor TGA7-like isoform X2 [Ipomoea nil]
MNMVSYQAMNIPSTSQFAPTRMGLYEPFHPMRMWEETLRGDMIPSTGGCMVTQANERTDDNKFDYKYNESAIPSPSGDNQAGKGLTDKAQRRLAQNREAARKSRLRKKAYVQQLETSRLKLAQLELELEKARQQGICMFGASSSIGLCATLNPGIAAFELDYTNWIEEHQKKTSELRNILQAPTNDMELEVLVQSVLSHYCDLFRMKVEVAKADVFYLISGAWRTPVERFYLWIGGFRPSEMIKVVLPQLGQLSEQQRLNVNNLRHCCQQAEDALTQGMDKLQQTLSQNMTLITTGAGTYSTQMASAIEKLEALESFVNQADHLRQQTLLQMSRILTTHQAARGLLAFGEYFQRLRSLSSLWAARPRETTLDCC